MKGSKKLWKPPSFEDFNVESQCKRIKLDDEEAEKEKQESQLPTINEPKTISELATHPKKIEEIKNWFERVISVRAPILLITGPAGSAKTVTLKVVASSLNISLREWLNPMDKVDFKNEFITVDKSDYTEGRQLDKFEDFIFRASRYKSLFESNERTAILVEDFPNIFIWKPKLFYEFLEKYQANGKSPIVFICTDDQNLNLNHDLFPSLIKTKYNISEVKFNPVNQSSLIKTLKKVITTKKNSLSTDILQTIAQTSNGDLRNALSNLDILLTSSKPDKGKKINRKKEIGQSQSSGEEPVSIKDNRAEFYQALGRVLYPKTIKKMGKDRSEFENEKRIFVHDVVELSNSFTDTFLMLLHENYITTFSSLKNVVQATSVFSVCDRFLKEDELREYAGLITVIGLMINNKEPKREGFKPIKKSSVPSTSDMDIWVKKSEYLGLNATARSLACDYIPYMKILGEPRCTGICDNVMTKEEEDVEDNLEIEDFDD